MERLEGRAMLAIVVNTLTDELDGNITTDGDVSLRDAIVLAPTNETITFDPSVPGMNGGTINLLASMGQITIPGKTLTIDASGLTNGITINADDPASSTERNRIFNITDPTSGATPPTVTLKKLRLVGGNPIGNGGAIQSTGFLNLQDCTIDDNNSTGFGGGIYLGAAGGSASQRTLLTITSSTISNNSASRGGGMLIYSGYPGTPINDQITITGSTFEDLEQENAECAEEFLCAAPRPPVHPARIDAQTVAWSVAA
jgi:hypothetical protein